MAVAGWILDKSAAARADTPAINAQLGELVGSLAVCPVGELEQLYSARSAKDYDALKSDLRDNFEVVGVPPDLLDRALRLQHDLAHHQGMWHRTPIADLLSRGPPCTTVLAWFMSMATSIVSRKFGRLPSGV